MQEVNEAVLLDMLDRYAAGERLAAIARAQRVSPKTLRKRLVRVVDDDCAHDPEARAYWTSKGMPT
jgi:hypothetical protein